jgi:hypothetical protein
MLRIAITQAAFEAIARTFTLGNASLENKTNERGEKLIWLQRAVVDRLRSLRGWCELQRRHFANSGSEIGG